MKRTLVLLAAVTVMLIAAVPIANAAGHDLDVSVVRAPIVPDGTTAGAQSDFVVTFADRDPSVDGFMLTEGDTIALQLPPGFVNVGELPDGTPVEVKGLTPPDCVPGNLVCSTAVLLRGWPQSAVPPDVAYDEPSNTLTLTLRAAQSVPAPGAKQVHFIGLGFRNPGPGKYPIDVTITQDGTVTSGSGTVHIIPNVRPSINGVSVEFTGSSFVNEGNLIYQSVPQGSDPKPFIFNLWSRGGDPFSGVDLEMDNANRGRLVMGNRTVGHVRIEAPRSADGYTLTSLGPSEAIPASFAVGVPTAQWNVQFSTPDAGEYTITFRANGGNTQQHFVTVTD